MVWASSSCSTFARSLEGAPTGSKPESRSRLLCAGCCTINSFSNLLNEGLVIKKPCWGQLRKSEKHQEDFAVFRSFYDGFILSRVLWVGIFYPP